MGDPSSHNTSYLRFLMERAGCPEPKRIHLVSPVEEWAERQIIDEIKLTWPSAEVVAAGGMQGIPCDLVIVPFDGHVATRLPIYERNGRANWVMFYGLELRRIRVFEFDDAARYLQSTQRYGRIQHILRGTGLLRLLKPAIRIWKRRSNR